MKRLLILSLFLAACSDHVIVDTMEAGTEQEERIIDSFVIYPKDAGFRESVDSSQVIDMAVCQDMFDNECMPKCLEMKSKSDERKTCISHCEYYYKVCTGCYGDLPNQ